MACTYLGDYCWEVQNAEEWGNHWKKNFFINNSVGLSMCYGPIEAVKYILVNIGFILDWILSQNYTFFAYSWSSSKQCKNINAVAPEQLLAAKADAVAYQMDTTTTWNFNYYMYCLSKTTRSVPFVFSHFIMTAIPHVKCDLGSGQDNRTAAIILKFWVVLEQTFLNKRWNGVKTFSDLKTART